MYREIIFQNTGVSSALMEKIHSAFANIYKDGDQHTELCAIMRKHKSDKGFGPHGKHNYTQVYSELFSPIIERASQIFEVGLGTNNTDIPSNMGVGGTPGASLRGWRDYFTNAKIFGADVDRRIIFKENRISTFYLDQLDKSTIDRALSVFEPDSFDFVLDDGLHRFPANKNLHEVASSLVKGGGFYIIEDINVGDENIDVFSKYLASLDLPSVLFKLPHQRDIPDNCIAIIEH
jgi:SAM-dependent methyltransferase